MSEDGNFNITPKGKAFLKEAVTNTEGNVYTFYNTLSPKVVAAAMARLSRFGGDMRELILKEFSGQKGEEEALLQRVLTQFGDDSVQQLGMVPVVVENASNLLTKQLEWGRLAAYLEQSTRYIYFDQKRNNKYRYYTPLHFPDDLKKEYKHVMNAIFDNYSKTVHKLSEWLQKQDDTPEKERDVAWRIAMRGKACDAVRGLLPASTTSTVGIVGSAQAIDNLIMHLLSQNLPEANDVGEQILNEVRKQHAIFFERTDLPNRGKAIIKYRKETKERVQALAGKIGLNTRKETGLKATLLEYTPKDELELIAHLLYPYVTISFAELEKELSGWSEDELVAALELYMGARDNRRHKPGRAMEVAHYTFELVCDYGIFRDLQRHRMVDALEWQQLSPSLGYDVPKAVKDAGLEELYHQTHELSETFFSTLVKNGYKLEAQYATLLDHRMRWKVTINARAAFHFIELRTQPAGHLGYRQISKMMHDEIEKVHPRIAKAMIFVNRNDDDPATSRLEQNRRAQEKLKKLGLGELIEG